MNKTLTWQQFEQVDLRVGTIMNAEKFPEARNPAYILHVDFGEEIGVLKSSAQITGFYQPDDLIGKQVIAVVNFPSKQIGPIKSQCLVTGFHRGDEGVVLATVDLPVPNGTRLS
ncbi:tRNA-binding protein [Thalassotalea fusca]